MKSPLALEKQSIQPPLFLAPIEAINSINQFKCGSYSQLEYTPFNQHPPLQPTITLTHPLTHVMGSMCDLIS